MKVMKEWLTELHTARGMEHFYVLYAMSPWEMIVRHQLLEFSINWKNSPVRHIILVASGGIINQVFSLEEDDYLRVYSDQRGDGIFNTDGMAFMHFLREDENDFFYSVENSPYDLPIEEIAAERQKTPEEIIQSVNNFLLKNKVEANATKENVLFVGQL